MTWMLTGGAGYIGAHIVRAFDAAGLPVVVLDDLSTGIRANVPPDVPFVQASVSDPGAVRTALREHRVTGVLVAVLKSDARRYPDDVLVEIVLDHPHDLVLQRQLAEAFRRGAACTGDYTQADHLALAEQPLDAVREQFGIPARLV